MGFKMKGFPMIQTSALKKNGEKSFKKQQKKSKETLVCGTCGAPIDNHPYRHPIFTTMTRNQWREKNKPELNIFDTDSTMYKEDLIKFDQEFPADPE
jgi:hypothetical protein